MLPYVALVMISISPAVFIALAALWEEFRISTPVYLFHHPPSVIYTS